MHRKTWYTDTCGMNSHGLTIQTTYYGQYVYYTGLWIYWFRDHGVTNPNGSVTIRLTSLVGVSHQRSNSIVPLILHTVYCEMARALALYYRSLRTTPTLLRMCKISGKPYIRVMTYKTLIFLALKYLGNYRRQYTIIFKNLKPY